MESFHFAFGGDDVFVIVDAPNNETVAAVSSTVSSSGALTSCETVVLLTAEEMDAATGMSVAYTPPGG